MCIKLLLGEPGGNMPFRMPRPTQENNVKIYLNVLRCGLD
jgi:hypothetical protein